MTSSKHDPRLDHHPHLAGHDHAHVHPHEHQPDQAHVHSHGPDHTHSSDYERSLKLSRRGFLFTAAATATGLLFAKLERVAGRPLLPAPAAQKRIYIAPDDHTDYMWAGDEATYRAVFLEMLDYYLDLADSTAGNASPYQSRWNCDGTLWVWEYEHNRSTAQFQRLIERIRDGHISVPLNPLCVVLGGAPAEAVLRGMYYAGSLQRSYDLDFPLAYAMENTTLPYGIGALWAGAGARYSWKGICGCVSKVPDAWDREHEIYWWVGPDGSRLLMKWNSMLDGNQNIGGYAEARNPSAVVDFVSSNSGFLQRYAYAVIGAFGKGWDDLKTLTSEFISVAQAKTTSDRQVIVSNEHDFFEDFEATYSGSGLPELRCTFGNEWELYVASLAEVSARLKRAVAKLRGAEALATLVSLYQPTLMNGREAARDQAFLNLGLYWEHCWTADGYVSRNSRRDWQRRLVDGIEAYVDPLYSAAASALGGLIQRSGENTRFFVFNPLSWARTDVADYAYTGAADIHVIDVATAQEVPSQIVTVDGQQYLRILASDVPSVGYKVYEIQAGPGTITDGGPTADTTTGVLENAAYQVTVAGRGAITSLLDKNNGNREFARAFNGYSINDLGGSSGTLSVESSGPVSATLKAVAAGPVAHTTRVTLIRGLNRIDIRNDITQNFSAVLKWRFGFEIATPDVWHEEVGAIIHAKYTTDGGHYYSNSAHQNARYDWLTLNRFVDMSGAGVGVTLANADCYYMQLGNSTISSLDTTTPQISVLAGGQVDGSNYGIPNQGGETNFLQRFALQTHGAYDPAAAMRMALEQQNPLITGTVTGGNAYPASQFSLLTISDTNVLLSALKPADGGIFLGIVARVWNLSNSPASCTLNLPGDAIDPGSAFHLTHIERRLTSLPVAGGAISDTLAAQQMKTYALLPQSLLARFPNHAFQPLAKK